MAVAIADWESRAARWAATASANADDERSVVADVLASDKTSSKSDVLFSMI